MIRRTTIVAALAVTLTLSACSTFDDNNVVPRVADVDLSQSDFAVRLTDAEAAIALQDPTIDDGNPNTASSDVSSTVLNQFFLTEIVKADLAKGGATLPDFTVEDTSDTWAVSNQEFNFFAQTWLATLADPPPLDQLRQRYAEGPLDSGIACTAHILTDTEAEAQAVHDELAAGADFAELAAERSTDAGSGAAGGVLPCGSTASFQSGYVPEYVEGALAATIGEATDPIESQFGFHVILLRPFDDIDPAELDSVVADPGFRLALVANDLDLYLDPRYGTFEPLSGVVPLS